MIWSCMSARGVGEVFFCVSHQSKIYSLILSFKGEKGGRLIKFSKLTSKRLAKLLYFALSYSRENFKTICLNQKKNGQPLRSFLASIW